MPTGNVPKHIAIIMDGNGRWAKERGLPRLAGHRSGAKAIEEAASSCSELGVEILTLFAFSTENWKRPKYEVRGLMGLLRRFLKEKADALKKNNIKLNVIGRVEHLPDYVKRPLTDALLATKDCDGLLLNIALNYGGRAEITDACRAIAKDVQIDKIGLSDIDEPLISEYLYTKGMPDPDLLIRTSGEMRLSNFLLWQLAYAEIYVTKKFWPAFRREDLKEAIVDYRNRQRRFGG